MTARLARALAVASLVAVFLAFMGAPAYRWGFPGRLIYMLSAAWIATLMAIGFNILTERLGWAGARSLRQALLTAVMMTVPMGLLVWAGDQVLAPWPAPLAQLPIYVAASLVISGFMNLLAWGLARQTAAAPAEAKAPPRFLERLPFKLRGAELWAVQAEDHYLRLHTSRGQDLILLRLADAVAELEGLEGARVHRSWWVARDAVADMRRADGRASLMLKDGTEAPVSRSGLRSLRALGWL